ncbi:MAG TPA: VWA domain-containing protein [Pyrinomonadaceae bacterium]|jgi:VWFA-related protein
MLYKFPAAQLLLARAPRFGKACVIAFALALLAALCVPAARAQGLVRELSLPEKGTVSIKNRNGRVTVIATDELKNAVSLKAESTGAAIEEADVISTPSGSTIEIVVRRRTERDRIDLTLRVPTRAKVRVESEAGAVDVAGNFESAEVRTNTGTIHADVPTDAVSFEFMWEASRPRYFSDVELPKVKEKAGGWYSISGKLGEKKAKREERVRLDFSTQRGVILFNVDPSMVPSDLRDRPLTEAARAIVRSGDGPLMEAIRKVSPKLFGDYAKTLPPPKEAPSLVTRRAPGEVTTEVSPQLLRLNVSVTDRNGRALSGLAAQDFTLYENGQERKIVEVKAANAPFNLVLLLDVSGSVEERIDFIRKAARNFLATASPQDRISIISFRDDIQIISEFTTDRQKLSVSLDKIDAGGGTALFDALAYTLVDTLKPLRGERTAIVILSDGDDNKSFVPFGAVQEAIIESGALIYPLYVPSILIPESSVAAPTTTLDPTRSRYLTITTRAEEEGKKLATLSGGIFYPIRRLEDLQRAYDDVVAQLRMSYTITYASNSAPAERRVRVRVNRDGASARPSPVVNVGTTSSEGARR